jgi:hypothetical protein
MATLPRPPALLMRLRLGATATARMPDRLFRRAACTSNAQFFGMAICAEAHRRARDAIRHLGRVRQLRHMARRYVAQLVVESTVEGQDQPIASIETVLLHADSVDSAHSKAQAIAQGSAHGYRNKAGYTVVQRYVAIYDLDCLQTDQLMDGDQIAVRVIEGPAAEAVRARSELSVFGGQRTEVLSVNQ